MNDRNKFLFLFILLFISALLLLSLIGCKPVKMEQGVGVAEGLLKEGMDIGVIHSSSAGVYGIYIKDPNVKLIDEIKEPLVKITRPEFYVFRFSQKGRVNKGSRIFDSEGKLREEEWEIIEPIKNTSPGGSNSILLSVAGLYVILLGYTGGKGIKFLIGLIKKRR